MFSNARPHQADVGQHLAPCFCIVRQVDMGLVVVFTSDERDVIRIVDPNLVSAANITLMGVVADPNIRPMGVGAGPGVVSVAHIDPGECKNITVRLASKNM